MQIILASASPRRQELIKEITDNVLIIPADVDETIEEGICPKDSAEYLSKIKAMAVAKEHPECVVIGCDTIVLLGDKILGKPKDKDDAREMIASLSGTIHYVITGCTIVLDDKIKSFSETTEVEFLQVSQEEIEEYINSDEPYDKAGGYAVQGEAGGFVKRIKGDYNNVVGLPVDRLRDELNSFLGEII